MAATNEMITEFQGLPRRTVAMGTLATGVKIWKGAQALHLGGVVRPVVSGATLAALCTTIPGADANGGVTLRALRQALRVVFLGGTSKTLSLDSFTFGASTLDLNIQLATDNAGTVTTTATALVNFIRSHAFLNQCLVAQATGTGAGLSAVATATAIVYGGLLGAAADTYDNAAGNANLAIPMLFQQGAMRVATGSPAPTAASIGGQVLMGEDLGSVTTVPGPLDFTAELTNIDSRGAVYVRVGA